MANVIKLRRSAVSGNVPTTSQLELGEIAINTADGVCYIKRTDGTGDEIVRVGGSSTLNSTKYRFETSTSNNPGSGKMHFNAAFGSDYSSVTEIYLNNTDKSGQDLSTLYNAFLNDTYRLYVQKESDASKAALFNVTGAVSVGASVTTIPVAFIQDTASSLSGGKDCAVVFSNVPNPSLALDGLADVSVSNPSNGQVLQYVSANAQWEAVTPSGGSGSSVSISETPPTGGGDGDLWYDSSTNSGKLYLQYGGQFVATAATGSNGADGADGADGPGFTGGSYDAGTGIVTFTSDDGLGFSTTDLRGADGADGTNGTNGTNGTDGADGQGFTGGSYDAGTGVVTFTSDDGLGFSTADLRGADGADGTNGTNGTDGADGAGVPVGGTAGQVLAKIDGTDYNTQWVNQSGGSSTPMYISTRGPASTQALVQNVANTVNVDGATLSLSNASHFLVSNGGDATGSIRVVNAGTYQISYNVFATQTGGNRVGIITALYLNGAIVSGTKQYSYSRNAAQNDAGCSSTIILDCSANDLIEVKAEADSSVAIAADLDSCSLTLLRIV